MNFDKIEVADLFKATEILSKETAGKCLAIESFREISKFLLDHSEEQDEDKKRKAEEKAAREKDGKDGAEPAVHSSTAPKPDEKAVLRREIKAMEKFKKSLEKSENFQNTDRLVFKSSAENFKIFIKSEFSVNFLRLLGRLALAVRETGNFYQTDGVGIYAKYKSHSIQGFQLKPVVFKSMKHLSKLKSKYKVMDHLIDEISSSYYNNSDSPFYNKSEHVFGNSFLLRDLSISHMDGHHESLFYIVEILYNLKVLNTENNKGVEKGLLVDFLVYLKHIFDTHGQLDVKTLVSSSSFPIFETISEIISEDYSMEKVQDVYILENMSRSPVNFFDNCDETDKGNIAELLENFDQYSPADFEDLRSYKFDGFSIDRSNLLEANSACPIYHIVVEGLFLIANTTVGFEKIKENRKRVKGVWEFYQSVNSNWMLQLRKEWGLVMSKLLFMMSTAIKNHVKLNNIQTTIPNDVMTALVEDCFFESQTTLQNLKNITKSENVDDVLKSIALIHMGEPACSPSQAYAFMLYFNKVAKSVSKVSKAQREAKGYVFDRFVNIDGGKALENSWQTLAGEQFLQVLLDKHDTILLHFQAWENLSEIKDLRKFHPNHNVTKILQEVQSKKNSLELKKAPFNDFFDDLTFEKPNKNVAFGRVVEDMASSINLLLSTLCSTIDKISKDQNLQKLCQKSSEAVNKLEKSLKIERLP